MRFLADESCDFAAVRALRAAGHEVTAVAEIAPRAPDEVVVDLALREGRILLTEDKDFGQLVYASGLPTAGVILIRYPTRSRAALSAALTDLVDRSGERLPGSFVVLQPGRIRVGRSPDE